MNPITLAQTLESILAQDEALDERLKKSLDAIADDSDAVTATLHRVETGKSLLEMVACRGIPEKLVPITRTIPFGKGMAGLCAERRAPVTVCNLQTDTSGVARPGARETGVAGSIVIPILTGEGDELVGTLGIGKAGEHDYSEEETECLSRCAAILSRHL